MQGKATVQGSPPGRHGGATVLGSQIGRSVSQRMFDSMLDDIRLAICAYREQRIDQEALLALGRDRLDALEHLCDDGSVSRALEHAETALVEAVIGPRSAINFEQERRRREAEESDA